MAAVTADAFLDGRITIKQHRSGYRFSIDAVILAAHARPRAGEAVVDLGTGCGVIPLILAHRNPDIRICGIEVQKELAEIAQWNVNDNNMADRIVIRQQDIKRLTPGMVAGPVDLVVSNPPYRLTHSGRLNPDRQKAVARHEISVTLADVVESANRILRTSGRFITIYPAERLTDVISQMRTSRIEPKKLRTIHSGRSIGAKLILVEGVKAVNPGMKILPPLFIYTRQGGYSREVQKMFLH
ncbi:MAG: tRNA1(Val) (adenine(37)-N6)-methyltransferase [Desulfobacterales bacterium]|nr:tRNA1(Val) (adenine(37)-N6)-methyltransferase [Desulfobacterales bacterium]